MCSAVQFIFLQGYYLDRLSENTKSENFVLISKGLELENLLKYLFSDSLLTAAGARCSICVYGGLSEDFTGT